MATKKTDEIVNIETVTESEVVNPVVPVEPAPVVIPENPEVVVYEMPQKKSSHSVARNILIGTGLAVTGSMALYGLYELGKKGFMALKNRKEKKAKGNGLAHPDYEYKKVEGTPQEAAENEVKAKSEKGKRPMGFHYTK